VIRRAVLPAALACLGVATSCTEGGTVAPLPYGSDHSSSIALSADESTAFVVNPDADSVSFVDVRGGTLVREVLLASAPPQQDPSTLRFDPAVGPRAMALGPQGLSLYVTGQRSGHVYSLDPSSGAILRDADVCSEPAGIVVSPDGGTVYVACSQDDEVVALDATSLVVTATASVDRRPWGLGWSLDRTQLYVTHLLGPGLTVLSPTLAEVATWPLTDGPAGGDPAIPHGPVRGIYDVLARPGTGEAWVAHLMLGIDTPQPALVFDDSAFPALSLFDPSGAALARLTVSIVTARNAPVIGAFGDVVSGPHALGFSPDGALAFVADADSEDVLVVDAVHRVEVGLVRPLPGHQPEGIAVSRDGHVYVDERNSSDVAVLTYDGSGASVAGPPIARLAHDPMPAAMRLGQHVFFSANSDELPITSDHWMACASCHIEGRSDAVTWKFLAGPRDTPSNAGGVAHTGFLLRTAARRQIQDYSQVIDLEQGGHFSRSVPLLESYLDALEQYVDYAIPYPSAPRGLDPAQVAQGQQLFGALGCAGCHAGSYFTDSGAGNPTLDLSGPVVSSVTPGGIVLHDVGTCVTEGLYPDVAVADDQGDPRGACAFDTPTLRGVSESAPYLHDGSAATLEDVFRLAPGMVGPAAAQLDTQDLEALVAYLKSL
jgi:YVTN family beta-propeller protein